MTNCRDCGSSFFVAPLHGAKGGPWLCAKCRMTWDQENAKDRKYASPLKRELHGDNHGDSIFAQRDVPYLTLDLLRDALRLTHPDCHPPERTELAQRVTAELLALKPYTLPRPEPEPSVTARHEVIREPTTQPLCLSFPCRNCYLTVPFYYCDDCRKIWDEHQLRERERINRQARERRRRKRENRRFVCAACGELFKPTRKDARYCSAACRQAAHRKRVTEIKSLARNPLNSRNNAAGVAP